MYNKSTSPQKYNPKAIEQCASGVFIQAPIEELEELPGFKDLSGARFSLQFPLNTSKMNTD